MQSKNKKRNRAFTLIELLVVIAIIALLVGILMPALAQARRSAKTLKCSTQVRSVMQAMMVFANSNRDSYPLPSNLDKTGTTVAGSTLADNEKKNNLGNVLSILIFNNGISSELCVSPAEVSGVVKVCDTYASASPAQADVAGGNRATALWDPGFAGTPVQQEPAYRHTPGISNNSYASIVFFGARRQKWTNTFSATEPVFGNRGPVYNGADGNDRATWAPSGQNGWRLANGANGTDSNTLLIHGGRSSWEGNIGYNDGHVNTETRADPLEITYKRTGNQATNAVVPDNIFVDETDDATGGTANDPLMRQNVYLRPIGNVSNFTPAAVAATLWKD
ncbi:MAG: type II secretion system protein [Phycisphaerales bacterium]